jgi:hypothetical protein
MKPFVLLLVFASACFGVIIPSDRLYEWSLGYSVGPQIAFPENRTNLLNVVTQFGADNTGTLDAGPAIQAAIDAAVSNDVIYLPNGFYIISNAVVLSKSWVSLRGESTNVVLVGRSLANVLTVGNSALGADPFRTYSVTNGGEKGSTNLVLASVQSGYGDTIKANDMLILTTVTRNTGTEAFPIIGITGFDRIIKQIVVIHSRNGNTVSITAPLVWHFTNSAMLQEVDTLNQPRRGVVVENFSVTLTNGGVTGDAGFMVKGTCLRDSWFTNLNIGFAAQYHLYITESANVAVQHCDIHDTVTPAVSNHGGLILENVSGLLLENTIFFADNARAVGADGDSTTLSDNFQLFPAIEINTAVMGCAFVGNFFWTNCLTTFHVHNAHPMMNLIEQNQMTRKGISLDGYFGSASHFTFNRNADFTFSGKRFSSQLHFTGNSIGFSNTYSFLTYRTESGYGEPYALLERGFPAIGHNSYEAVSPPMHWAYPGKRLFAGFSSEFVTNGIFVITNAPAYATNAIHTNMGMGYFTNLPDANIALYALIFQDGTDTNFYYGATNASQIVATAKTESNLTLNAYVYLTNGSTLYIAGSQAYTQLQSSNGANDIVHGNYLYTNGVGQAGTLSWHPDIADHALVVSYLYGTIPSWWGTNRWPAIDPEAAVVVASIPSQNRYFGIDNGTSTNPPWAPTLTAQACATSVRLTWTPNGQAADGYYVQRGTVSGMLTTVTNLGTSVNAWTNTDLSNGTEYFYTITASNEFGFSDASSEESATPVATPSAPSGLDAVAGDSKVTLSWNTVSGAAGYVVRRGTVSGDLSIVTIVTGLGYTNTGLNNGTLYYFDVATSNICAEVSSFSAEDSATPVGEGSSPGKSGHIQVRRATAGRISR